MVWKSATYRDNKGWYAEFEIPYSALRLKVKYKIGVLMSLDISEDTEHHMLGIL